jgi:hypothetical protein
MPVYQGKTLRVLRPDHVLVRLDLGFHVMLERGFDVIGIRTAEIPADRRADALHCLVVLLGGKRLLLSLEDDDATAARIYLNERVHGTPAGLHPVSFDSLPRLDVGLFMSSMMADFSVMRVKGVLNG